MTGGPTLFERFFDEVDATEPLRAFILTELGSPSRRWHGLLHHALMLRRVARSPHRGSHRRRLILAVLFHDIVYDATRPDNEEASAAEARRWLVGEEADAVVALILATKAHDLAAADPLTRTLLEADLAVLWTPLRPLYAFYSRGIRAEYGHVPDEAYRAGRTAVLDQLQERIAAAVPAAHAKQLARNLDWERAALAAGAFDRPAP